MSNRYCIGYFENEHDVVRAVADARASDYDVQDVFTPYPVHGLDKAMGLAPSRLVWVGIGAGVLGLTLGLAFQAWTSAYDWPIIIGGQPFLAWPAFIPVTFELTVLLSGIIGVLALLACTKLWPGRAAPKLRRVSDDRFAIVLVQSDASIDAAEMVASLWEYGAVEVDEGDEIA